MRDTNWIKELEVGDKFFTDDRWGGVKIHTVVRITKTQIIAGRNYRFRKVSGRAVGDYGYHTSYMEQISDKITEKLIRQNVSNRIKAANISEMDIEKVKKLCEILRD